MSGEVTWLGVASVAVACVALVISVLTLWITHLRRGTIRMTRPSQFYFGADGSKSSSLTGPPKIFFRALLYATSKRGRVLESMWVTLYRGEARQTFNIWVYGDEYLQRGAGLFVGETGVVTSHHFLLPENENFSFREGEYDVRIFGRLVGDDYVKPLMKQKLTVSAQNAEALASRNAGVYFDFGPISGAYTAKQHAPVQDWLDSMKTGLSSLINENQGLPKEAG